MPDDQNLLGYCPIWKKACLQEKCISYESHTKQRFKNIKTGNYIPIDQLHFYSGLSQSELEETVERHIRIARECRAFGKIIQIEDIIDHEIPTEE